MIFTSFFLQNVACLTIQGRPSVSCNNTKALEWRATLSKNLDPFGKAALGVHVDALIQLIKFLNSIMKIMFK